MRTEAIQPTREQHNAIEAIYLDHGTVAVSMTRSIAGVLAHVRCATGLVATVNEDGCVIVERLVRAMPCRPATRSSAEYLAGHVP